MKTIEIELRYEVLDAENLAAFVAPLTLLHKKHDVDIYLDRPDALHFQQGLYLRIRNGKKLDIKFNRACLEDPTSPIQDFCEEHSFVLPLQIADLTRLNDLLTSIRLLPLDNPVVGFNPDFELFKRVNNLDTYYTVDKVRTSYRLGEFTLAVDEVAGLGSFLEIELMAKTSEALEGVKRDMQRALAGLKVRPAKAGYGTLLMRKNNFAHYLRGRFVLAEDLKSI